MRHPSRVVSCQGFLVVVMVCSHRQAFDRDGDGAISAFDASAHYLANGAAHSVPEVGYHKFGLGLADASGDKMVSWDEFHSRFGRLNHSFATPTPSGVRSRLCDVKSCWNMRSSAVVLERSLGNPVCRGSVCVPGAHHGDQLAH